MYDRVCCWVVKVRNERVTPMLMRYKTECRSFVDHEEVRGHNTKEDNLKSVLTENRVQEKGEEHERRHNQR